ncbi:Cys/Met metabolism PLP-dependent enzyme-domain-containing protein [Pavlovales sp. CCMP2436]|nr:Cys/Met metabolism PLP-dependent enzyme-domain-containing protein [Pavlovales sp. CCMP2436]
MAMVAAMRSRLIFSSCRALRYASGTPRDALATVAVHADAQHDARARARDGSHHELDIAPPLGVSTTFETADGGPGYSRATAPTRERCERVLASIEAAGGTADVRALLYSSGAAATYAALHYLLAEAGATRLCISGGYHGTHVVAEQLRRIRAGLEIAPLPAELQLRSWLDGSLASVEAPPVRPGDILWVETPKNPACEVSDVVLYRRAADAAGGAAAGVFVVVDSTFAPPPAQTGLLERGADLVMHSTTKALSGHSDALGGALLVPCAEAYAALRAQRTALGAVPGSLEAWLLLRSLRTLELV